MESHPVALVCGALSRSPGEARGALVEEGFDVASCAGAEAVFREAMRRAPDLVVYETGPDRAADREILEFVRCLCPTAPLVIAGDGGSLEFRRGLQEFRPTYFALDTTCRSEWRHLVRAIARRTGGSSARSPDGFGMSRR